MSMTVVLKYLAGCKIWMSDLSLQKARAVMKINIACWKQCIEQF